MLQNLSRRSKVLIMAGVGALVLVIIGVIAWRLIRPDSLGSGNASADELGCIRTESLWDRREEALRQGSWCTSLRYNGVIENAEGRDVYLFRIGERSALEMFLTYSGGSRSVIALTRLDGTIISDGTEGMFGRYIYSTLEPGDYFAEVIEQEGRDDSRYSLSVNRFPIAADGEVVPRVHDLYFEVGGEKKSILEVVDPNMTFKINLLVSYPGQIELPDVGSQLVGGAQLMLYRGVDQGPRNFDSGVVVDDSTYPMMMGKYTLETTLNEMRSSNEEINRIDLGFQVTKYFNPKFIGCEQKNSGEGFYFTQAGNEYREFPGQPSFNCGIPTEINTGRYIVQTNPPAPPPDDFPVSEVPVCSGSNFYEGTVPKGNALTLRSADDDFFWRVAVADPDSLDRKPRETTLCWAVAGMSEAYYRSFNDGGPSAFLCSTFDAAALDRYKTVDGQGVTIFKPETANKTFNQYITELYENNQMVREGRADNLAIYPAFTQAQIRERGLVFITQVTDSEVNSMCSTNVAYNEGKGVLIGTGRGSTPQNSNCATWGSSSSPRYCSGTVQVLRR